MIKPPLQNNYIQQKEIDASDPTIDLNRIQQQIQNFVDQVQNNLQENLFTLELNLHVSAPTTEIKDKAIYVEREGEGNNRLDLNICHTDKTVFNNPVFIGVGRDDFAEGLEPITVSTVIHTSDDLKLGTVISLDEKYELIGISEGVGLIRLKTSS